MSCAHGGGNPEAHAQAYFMRGLLAVLQSDPDAARSALERAVSAAREGGHFRLLSESLSVASIAENMVGECALAERLLDESRVIVNGLDDRPATLLVLGARAFNGLVRGDLAAVRSASSEGARLSREVGDLYSLGMMLMNLGFAALLAGDLDESSLCTHG